MPRNKHGYLKADALRSGVPDQYAVVRGDERHEVSIRYDWQQGGFVTEHVVLNLGTQEREVHTWQVGDDLRLAREKFAAVVRPLGGRV